MQTFSEIPGIFVRKSIFNKFPITISVHSNQLVSMDKNYEKLIPYYQISLFKDTNFSIRGVVRGIHRPELGIVQLLLEDLLFNHDSDVQISKEVLLILPSAWTIKVQAYHFEQGTVLQVDNPTVLEDFTINSFVSYTKKQILSLSSQQTSPCQALHRLSVSETLLSSYFLESVVENPTTTEKNSLKRFLIPFMKGEDDEVYRMRFKEKREPRYAAQFIDLHTLSKCRKADSWKRVSSFGIIVGCSTTYRTKSTFRNNLRSDLLIIDESVCRQNSSLSEIKPTIVYSFIESEKNSFKFRGIGDIVRIDRGLIDYFDGNDRTESSVQIRVQKYTTVAMWSYEHDSFRPFSKKEVWEGSHENSFEMQKGHLSFYTSDEKRIVALRNISRNLMASPFSFIIFDRDEFLDIGERADRSMQGTEDNLSVSVTGTVTGIHHCRDGTFSHLVVSSTLGTIFHVTNPISIDDVSEREKYLSYYCPAWAIVELPRRALLKKIRLHCDGKNSHYMLNQECFPRQIRPSTILFC